MSKRVEQPTVFVGLSGGVDSSVAALLLKKQGYKVVGVFMKNWSNTKDLKGECNWVAERRDAARVAAKLGIPFKTYDFEKEYKDRVLKYFIREYKNGGTPNPDIMCNKEVKFKLFLRQALKDGADFIATGHYAKISHLSRTRADSGEIRRAVFSLRGTPLNPPLSGGKASLSSSHFKKAESLFSHPPLPAPIISGIRRGRGVIKLLIPKDNDKDQTYFLYVLDQKILAKTLFPLGELAKKEVRQIAARNKLLTAKKKDSVGICFVGEVNIRNFLRHYIKFTPGNIINTKGEILGSHNGLEPFTIGQRRGINIGGTGPFYVVDKNFKTGDLVVTGNSRDPLLYQKELIVGKMHWISGQEPRLPLKARARVRYRQKLQTAVIKKTGNNYKVIFQKSQRAITSGQSLVIYCQGECLGGGII